MNEQLGRDPLVIKWVETYLSVNMVIDFQVDYNEEREQIVCPARVQVLG